MGAHDMGLGSANNVTIAGPIMAQNHGLFHGHPCYQIWTSEPYFNALCGMSVLYVALLNQTNFATRVNPLFMYFSSA